MAGDRLMKLFQRQLRNPLKRIALLEWKRAAYLLDNFPTDCCLLEKQKEHYCRSVCLSQRTISLHSHFLGRDRIDRLPDHKPKTSCISVFGRVK